MYKSEAPNNNTDHDACVVSGYQMFCCPDESLQMQGYQL